MKEGIKVIVIGGGICSANLMSALKANNIVVVDNDNPDLRSGDREEFYYHATKELKPFPVLPCSNNFIQQKMQGKRRVY